MPGATPKTLALEYILRETRKAKNALWNAIEREAPEKDIRNLQNKLTALDWLLGAAIKEDDAVR